MNDKCCNCGRKVLRNEARYRFCQITICMDCGNEPFEALKASCRNIKGCKSASADWKDCPAHNAVADAIRELLNRTQVKPKHGKHDHEEGKRELRSPSDSDS